MLLQPSNRLKKQASIKDDFHGRGPSIGQSNASMMDAEVFPLSMTQTSSCYKYGMKRRPLNLAGQGRSIEDSADACQRRCQRR